MSEIKPITMPGTHKNFLKYFKKFSYTKKNRILDVGAGHGAFTKTLFDMGYDVSACDLFPEIFMFDKIECKKTDVTKQFPYPDNSFDIAIAIEVSEHIIGHELFFRELSRILKPNGQLYLSTPNVLSLKSRIRYLFRGFNYSFGPLEMSNYDGLQHVSSLTLDQYNYVAIKSGFKKATFEIDKKQKSSTWIFFFLFPLMWLNSKIKNATNFHNHKKLLLGRLLFLQFENNKTKKSI